MKPKRVLVLLIALVLTLSCQLTTTATAESSEMQTVTYVPDFETIFPNPERGFCQYVQIIGQEYVPGKDKDDQYFFYRPYLPEGAAEASTSRIIHSYIHLTYYANTPQLPQELLDDLANGLAEVRREGMKAVLRCAYTMSMDYLWDVPIDTILSHMRQISKVVSANADVVLAIEAGYFGPWGEWHDNMYTTWQDRNGEYNPAGKDARAALVKGILETTPDHIKVGIRYCDYLEELLKNDIFTRTEKDRLGIHNDGIGNNPAIGGNYIDLQAGLKYVSALATSDGFHRYYGGETGLDELERYVDGYEFLDEAYANNITEYNGSWSIPEPWFTTKLPASGNDPAETTYQRFMRKIGYRLRLVSASFIKSADPGDTFDFSAVIDNDGFAGPINARPVYLVFDNGTTRRNIRLKDVEVRSWLGGDDHSGPYNIDVKDIKIPANLPAGNYTLALWLPDSSANLQNRPEYSIRLANKYMWDAQKGYNKLGVVTIGSTEAGMSSWAESGVTSAVIYGLATPELSNKYKSATTRAEFCRAAVNLLEQYYSLPAAGIIHKRDLLLLEQPFGYFIGDSARNTGDPGERIEGLRSVVCRSDGSSDWNPIIVTNPEQVPLKAGKTYTVKFKCKFIETPDKDFSMVFSSVKGDADKVYVPAAVMQGKAGDAGEVEITRTLGPYDDYSIYWNIPGKGAISIDDVIITEKGASAPTAVFDFEIPPLKPEPSTGSYSLSAYEMQEIHTDLGLQSGYKDFLEERRGMLTVMPSFTDTSDPAIRAAAALGITSGTGGGKFSPDAPLTREQAATMLANVLRIIGEYPSSPSAVNWADDKSISSWAQTAADVMYECKIMGGTSSTALVFSPKSPYTHEQSLLTLNNLWKYLESK